MSTIDITIAVRFFPSPGPAQVPDEVRMHYQRELLEAYGKEIDGEELISTNPLFQKKKGFLNKILGK